MATQLKIKKETISSKFAELILSKNRYIVAFGGRGSGKTRHFYMKYIYESFESKHFALLYVNKEFRNIRDQQFLGFKNTIKDLGLQEYFKFYEGDYRIQNLISGNWFIPKGMDNAEKTKGIEEVTNIWIDEVNKCTVEDVTTLDKLLRTPKAEYLQLAVSFNPVSDKHWLKSYFFDESGYLASQRFKDILIHNSTFKDNEFIDQKAYEETLIIGSNGDPAKLECDLYGRWGNIKKDNLFIFNYRQERHHDLTIQDNRNEFIWLSFDFNINPMTCLVFQKDSWFRWIHCLKEYRLENSDLYEFCALIKKDYPPHRILVAGDAAGFNRDVRSRGLKSCYQIIREELGLAASQIKVTPKSKKSNVKGVDYVIDKRNNANAILARHPNFKIANCPYLIEDIESTQANEQNKMKKDDDSKSHFLDAFCDFLHQTCYKWSNFVK